MSKRSRRPKQAAILHDVTRNGSPRLTRRAWIGVAVGGAAVALLGERGWSRANPGTVDAGATPILVYASPSCSCCQAWMKHLETNGFRVSRELVSDVTPLKKKYQVPEGLWSCHTAFVEGYTVEGHVPADVIRKVLAQRPAFAGVAVPGMPNGAPGMEAAGIDSYDVISFTRSGQTDVYMARVEQNRS